MPAFQQCTAPDRTHGPPLAVGSCNPPVLHSTQLTMGTPDANGAPVKSTGRVRFAIVAGDPDTPADEADILLRVRITDVRRRSGLADYTGQLQASAGLRITDRDNPAPSGSPGATVQDSTFAWTVPCAGTSDTTIGSTCSVKTSADAVTPGVVKEGMRAVWELGKIKVFDGGPDDDVSTAPNTPFAVQGIFVP